MTAPFGLGEVEPIALLRGRHGMTPEPPAPKPYPTHYADGRRVPTPAEAARPGLLERLLPLPDLLSGSEADSIRQQAILSFGVGLMAGKGLGGALADVDLAGLTERALQMQTIRRQREAQAAVSRVTAAHPTKAGQTPYDRLVAIVNDLVGIPGTEDLVGKLSNVLPSLRPREARNRPFQLQPVVNPATGKITIHKIFEDSEEDTGLVPRPPVDPTISWNRPTDAQRTAGAFGANMASAHLGLRDLERNSPETVSEIATLVRSGRVAGSLPVIGPALDEAIRASKAPALSPKARELLAHFNSFIAAALPERGGKALTMSELRLYLEEFLQDVGDDPATKAVKVQNRLKRIRESQVKAATTWEDALRVFGLTNAQIFGEEAPTPEDDLDPEFIP